MAAIAVRRRDERISMITMELSGLDEMRKALQNASDEVRKKASEEVYRSAMRIQSAAVKRIQRGPASGEVYEKYNPRRTHQASAPGEPPMSDIGRLASSIEWNADSILEASVFSRVEYAPYLEFGTKNMEARPFLLPSVEEDAPRFREGLRGIL